MKKFPERIQLDGWGIRHELYGNAEEFTKALKSHNDEVLADAMEEDTHITWEMEDPEEVVLPGVTRAEIVMDYDGCYVRFPVTSFDRTWDVECNETSVPVVGITRKRVQVAIQNALAGIPLGDHRFPEQLQLLSRENDEFNQLRGVPVYTVSMGS